MTIQTVLPEQILPECEQLYCNSFKSNRWILCHAMHYIAILHGWQSLITMDN